MLDFGDTIEEGIIPARAGFTPTPISARISTMDHPRSRGVYRKTAPVILRFHGSSPLARGLPDDDLDCIW